MNLEGFYELISSDSNSITISLASKEHPIFKAHFPSKPILPAFMHFEIISEIFKIEIQEIKKAKFSELVLPNDVLEYKREKNKFNILVDNKQVATISL